MSATATNTRPYIGLRYFEARDAHLFYGRDEHVTDLLGKLAANRFVAVIGASGSGKSSLVRAGLFPELLSGMIPLAGPSWTVVEFKPGKQPLAELSDAIRAALGVENAREVIEQGPLGLARAVADATIDPDTNVLVIADQFEEIFRFQREESSQGRGKQAAEQSYALTRRLLDAAGQPELPIYVLLVMRSDYLGECAQFPDLPERMSGSLYMVPRLRRDQLQEAIAAPMGGNIEPALVQRLLSEVGCEQDQLPRLQHLLSRMWDLARGERFTMAHYETAGGWENGLDWHLETIYADLSRVHQETCRRVFQRLSELDKGIPTRRRAEIGELERVCGGGVTTVVKKFCEEGFLLPSRNPVDITHESVLRGWKRLQTWMADEERARVFYRELVARKDRPGKLHVSDLREVDRQRRAGRFDEHWAERYSTAAEFDAVAQYVGRSHTSVLKARIGLGVLIAVVLALGVYTVWSAQKQKFRARARELTAYAALARHEDPSRSLYLGLRAALMTRPMSPGGEAVLATALTEEASYGALRGHQAAVQSLAWSPDGKALASAGADETIRVWTTDIGQPLHVIEGHRGVVYSVAWTPDGKTLASAGADGTIRLWETDTWRPLRTLEGHRQSVFSVAWSPDGKTLASASFDATVRLWDAAGGRLRHALEGHRLAVNAVAWSPDGKVLASASDDKTIRFWDAVMGQPAATLEGHRGAVLSLAWSRHSWRLASAGEDTILLWTADLAQPAIYKRFEGHRSSKGSLAWSPDGETLASAGGRTVLLWKLGRLGMEEQPIRTLNGHRDHVLSVAWSRDGKSLASAGEDRTIRLWEKSGGQPLLTLDDHRSRVLSVAWSPHGSHLASADAVGTIQVREKQHLSSRRVFEADRISVNSVGWSPDGRTLASAHNERMVRLWNVASGQPVRTLEGHRGPVNSIAWSPDSRTLASASQDSTIRLWEAASGRPLRVLEGHQLSVNSVAWSPDGRSLVSASDDRTIRLWQEGGGRPLRTLEGHQGPVKSVAWSPDGRALASASRDQVIRLWQTATGRQLRTMEGHGGAVNSIAWSPDGKRLASASDDRTIRLWEAASGQSLRALEGHAGSVNGVAWSPDGKTLASVSDDGTVRLWAGTADELVDQVRARIRLFTLSSEECQRYFESDSCPAVR